MTLPECKNESKAHCAKHLRKCRVIQPEPGHIRTKDKTTEIHIYFRTGPHHIIFFLSTTENQFVAYRV